MEDISRLSERLDRVRDVAYDVRDRIKGTERIIGLETEIAELREAVHRLVILVEGDSVFGLPSVHEKILTVSREVRDLLARLEADVKRAGEEIEAANKIMQQEVFRQAVWKESVDLRLKFFPMILTFIMVAFLAFLIYFAR